MPEKDLGEIAPNLRGFYERARDEIDRGRFDQAITLLNAVLSAEPGCLRARQFLRVAQTKKFKAAGGGALKKGFAVFTGLGSMVKGQMAASKDPVKAMAEAEKMLNDDPTSIQAMSMLASAAEEAGFWETAAWTLEQMKELNPKDVNLLRRMGVFYMREEYRQPDKARECYEAILRLRPNDSEALKGMKDATAMASMMQGGWEQAKSYRDVIRDKAQAESLEQAARAVKTDDILSNQIREIEGRLQTEPDNLVHYRRLGELYTQKKNFDKAMEYFNFALERSGGDPSLEAAIADTQRRKFDHLILIAKAEYDKSRSDADKVKLEELEKAKAEFQIQDCERRRERYPNDLDIRFEMGQLYMAAGRTDDAIKEFQLAQRNPKRRVQTLNYLGQCFTRKNYLDLAAEQFHKGIKEHVPVDGLKKEMWYNLGVVLERMKKGNQAIEQFKKIMEVDFGYRDVAQKIDAFYAKQAADAEAAGGTP